MTREELEHLIRAAAEVTNEYEFVVVGRQSVLGPIPNPPAELTMSMAADIYPMNAEEKADAIDGALGEGSRFHETHGYYAQGVSDGFVASSNDEQILSESGETAGVPLRRRGASRWLCVLLLRKRECPVGKELRPDRRHRRAARLQPIAALSAGVSRPG
jgi:hypothetical protein